MWRSCNLSAGDVHEVDAAPNTFDIVDYPGGADNYGGGRTARVHTQWGDGEEERRQSKHAGQIHIYPTNLGPNLARN